MEKIVELIPSNDGKIRAAKILFPRKNTVNRSLNLFFPLECDNKNEDATNVNMRKNNERNDNPNDDIQKLTDEEFVWENKEPTRRSTRKEPLDTRGKIFLEQEHSLYTRNCLETLSMTYCTDIYP